MTNPDKEHWKVIKWILKYLMGDIHLWFYCMEVRGKMTI